MTKISLEKILKVTGGRALSIHAREFSAVGTDSRADLRGQLFIALKGENYDAHDFLEKAAQAGAGAVLIDHETPPVEILQKTITVILVKDTLKALQALGQATRRESQALVIGLTGSNGKTTTKEFIAGILSKYRDVHWSKGSFNNHWGVPLTLLQLQPQKDVAVIEMGMNHAGEITELVHIAEPDIVLCTMVGRAHVEYFGGIEAIAAAKEEIYEAAKPTAIRIYNLDLDLTKAMWKKSAQRFPQSRRMTFSSLDAMADVHLKIKRLTMRELEIEGHLLGEKGHAKVTVFGSQNLTNLMAAAAASLAVGLSPHEVWEGFAECKMAWGRNQFVRLRSGAEMIFDAYNANPDSMKALLENIRLLHNSGRKVGVFGQMRELGGESAALHEEIGLTAGRSGFDEIFFVGADEEAFRRGLKDSGFAGAVHADRDYTEKLGQTLARGLQSGDIVVLKASRGTKLERFVPLCEPLDFPGKD